MLAEVTISHVLFENMNLKVASEECKQLTEKVKSYGGFIYREFEKVESGYMITYAFKNEKDYINWKSEYIQ